MSLTLKAKPSGSEPFDVTIELEATVATLKEKIASKQSVSPESIRLVCAGKILDKEEATIGSCGIPNGASLYVVKNLVKKAPATGSAAESAAPSSASAVVATTSTAVPAASTPASTPAALDPMAQMMQQMMQAQGGASPIATSPSMAGQQGNPASNPMAQMMQQMMQAQGGAPPAPTSPSMAGQQGYPAANPMAQMMQQMMQARGGAANPGMPGQQGYPAANPMAQMMQQMMQQRGAASPVGNPMMQAMQNMQQGSPPPLSPDQLTLSADTVAAIRPKFKNELEDLKGMGFDDESACLLALVRHNGDLEKAVDELDKNPKKETQPSAQTTEETTYDYDYDGSEVVAHVYDISGGWAHNSSEQLIGTYMELLPHTAIVFDGKEYFVTHGPDVSDPGKSLPSSVKKVLKLGKSSKTAAELKAFLETLNANWAPASYSFLDHNSNHYADAVAKFLLDGEGLPQHLLSLRETMFATPQGQQMATMLTTMETSMRAMREGGSVLTPTGSIFHGGTSSGALASFGGGMPGMMPGMMPPNNAQAQMEAQRQLFSAQLVQLSAMGFTDEQLCIRALNTANGNVESAITFILANRD
eukprot:TRINITY_DN2113_c0_g3_i1.p1 TRINITY_DN2113_c0_g3~~TRINITY_DN2113_c0_g3_i1.p1  ORF type:complete len:587 (+),score=128.39 TRINITY_DN2113_c0_g3_i1:82-1842(+)